jgi:DNA-binding NarL/FixJ family response regulator
MTVLAGECYRFSSSPKSFRYKWDFLTGALPNGAHSYTAFICQKRKNIMNVGVISPQALFRKALCALLVGTGTFAVVLELATVFDPLTLADKSRPQILIVHAPDPADGIGTVRHLRDMLPGLRVLLLTDDPNDEFCLQAIEAGAWGCLSTSLTPQLLIKALEKVAQDERWVGHRLANLIIEKFVVAQQANTRPAERLTSREWEVLTLLANGRSDKEIAGRLFISTETAKSHLKSVYKKLQIRNRSAAAVFYFRHFRNRSDVPPPPEATTADHA